RDTRDTAAGEGFAGDCQHSQSVSSSSVSAHAVRERPAVSGAIEVELGRRTWPGAKGEAFTPPFLWRRLPGSMLPSRARANARATVWPRRSRRLWAALA